MEIQFNKSTAAPLPSSFFPWCDSVLAHDGFIYAASPVDASFRMVYSANGWMQLMRFKETTNGLAFCGFVEMVGLRPTSIGHPLDPDWEIIYTSRFIPLNDDKILWINGYMDLPQAFIFTKQQLTLSIGTNQLNGQVINMSGLPNQIGAGFIYTDIITTKNEIHFFQQDAPLMYCYKAAKNDPSKIEFRGAVPTSDRGFHTAKKSDSEAFVASFHSSPGIFASISLNTPKATVSAIVPPVNTFTNSVPTNLGFFTTLHNFAPTADDLVAAPRYNFSIRNMLYPFVSAGSVSFDSSKFTGADTITSWFITKTRFYITLTSSFTAQTIYFADLPANIANQIS